MQRHVHLVAVVLAFLVCCCTAPKKYEGVKYKVTLDSNPPGATLYLVPRTEWLELDAPRMGQSLDRWLVKENGGVAPVTDYYVVDYQHVLVGRLGDEIGTLEFKPASHGQRIVVTIGQP